MNALEPPDSFHLSAASGWLGLGNHAEAASEIENISAHLRNHPDVLQIRWGISYMAKNWNACFDIGRALVEIAPERGSSWRHRSASLHYMKRSSEAYDLLLPAVEKFREDWTIQYDMACYACVMGKLPEARERLAKAIQLGENQRPETFVGGHGAPAVREMALNDPDLQTLWPEINKSNFVG